MPDHKSIALTGATADNLSRHEMLQWVNTTLSGKYNKIEELCSGVAYCQLMEIIFPNCIGLKKVKTTAKLEHEFAFNLKLFQGAFLKLKFDKSVPIDRLVKGRFQDNFEFLQWFKRFYDMHSVDKENTKTALNTIASVKPIRKAISTSNLKVDCGPVGTAKKTTPTSASSSKPLRVKSSSTSHLTVRSSQTNRPVSPSSLETLNGMINQLRENIGTTEQERNYYYNRLQKVEILCNESEKNSDYVDFPKKVLAILYEKDSGDTTPQTF